MHGYTTTGEHNHWRTYRQHTRLGTCLPRLLEMGLHGRGGGGGGGDGLTDLTSIREKFFGRERLYF